MDPRSAARALLALDTDDLAALDRAGVLESTKGIGPATLSVVRDRLETGESRYLEQLRASTPEGLLELLRYGEIEAVPACASSRASSPTS